MNILLFNYKNKKKIFIRMDIIYLIHEKNKNVKNFVSFQFKNKSKNQLKLKLFFQINNYRYILNAY